MLRFSKAAKENWLRAHRSHPNNTLEEEQAKKTPHPTQNVECFVSLCLLLLSFYSHLFKCNFLTTTSSSRSKMPVTGPAAVAFDPAASAEGEAPSYCCLLLLLHYPALPLPSPSSSRHSPSLVLLYSRVGLYFECSQPVPGARARGPCAANRY